MALRSDDVRENFLELKEWTLGEAGKYLGNIKGESVRRVLARPMNHQLRFKIVSRRAPILLDAESVREHRRTGLPQGPRV